jgi:hypothetical protein
MAKERTMDERTTPGVSRRRALRRTAALGLGATLAWTTPGPAAAQGKLAKDAVNYVDRGGVPGKDCDDCLHYLAPARPQDPATCRVVEGPVSPHGHCAAFTPKA